jgi:hypothetical protein
MALSTDRVGHRAHPSAVVAGQHGADRQARCAGTVLPFLGAGTLA